MRAYRLDATISEDGKIHCEVPFDVPSGRAELVLLFEDKYEDTPEDDAADLALAREALAEYEADGRKSYPIEEVRKELGL